MAHLSRLKLWRLKRNLSQEDLGEKLGVNQWAVGRYEKDPASKNHRQPNRLVAEKLKELTDGEIHAGNYADDVSADSAEQVALNTAMSPQSGAPSQGEADAGSKQS